MEEHKRDIDDHALGEARVTLAESELAERVGRTAKHASVPETTTTTMCGFAIRGRHLL